jgi:phosphatidate cytidylyltransferase
MTCGTGVNVLLRRSLYTAHARLATLTISTPSEMGSKYWPGRWSAPSACSATSTSVYLPLFASFAAMLVEPADGAGRVLCFLIVVVCSDIGGYTAGVLFGRHPMAPSISPEKSWEGFSGSMVAGLIGGALSMVLLLHGHWWLGMPFGAALVITATGGDLMQSLIKRDIGVKDMGNVLPGHRSLMDWMGSLLPSVVVSWLLLAVLVPS